MKLAVVFAGAVLSLGGVARAQPPAAAFGRLPAIYQAAISPNGQMVAILGGPADTRTLSISTVDQPDVAVVKLGKVETLSIQWAANAYVLVRTAQWDNSLEKVAYRVERTYAITPAGKVASRLLDNSMDSNLALGQPILGVSSGDKPRVLMLGLHDAGEAQGNANTRLARKGAKTTLNWAIWSVDPANGNGAIAELGGFDTRGFSIDAAGQARVRLEVDELTHKFRIMARPKGRTAWAAVLSGDEKDSQEDYYGYSDPDDSIYLANSDEAGFQFVRLSLKDGTRTALGKPTRNADQELVRDPNLKTAVAIRTLGTQESVEWLDNGLGAIDSVLRKIFKGKQIELESWSADRNRFLFTVQTADEAPTWFMFDLPKKAISPLNDAYPELKDVQLGSTRAISYKARDGLDIPALVTMPPGAAAKGARLPLVVLPHGGPASHDDPDFDWLTQFIASRGYVVLRPQFRGSDGFGEAFEEAGHGEWAGKVQTDLQDGIAALAALGDVDPGRVCIVGASYGGYSALAGATFYPDIYRCAASIAGVADITLFLRENSLAYGRDSETVGYWRNELGRAGLAEQMAASPMQHADAVKIPILLVHGDRDTVVLPEQSQRMAAALTKAGKSVELVTLAGEDHYLMQSPTRIQMLESLGAFLARNLPLKP